MSGVKKTRRQRCSAGERRGGSLQGLSEFIDEIMLIGTSTWTFGCYSGKACCYVKKKWRKLFMMTQLQEQPLCLLKRLSLWGAEGQRPRRRANNKQTKKGDDCEIFSSFTKQVAWKAGGLVVLGWVTHLCDAAVTRDQTLITSEHAAASSAASNKESGPPHLRY